jgi:hypothetical protein
MFCDEYGSNVLPTDPAPPELLDPGLPALISYTGHPLG